MTAGLWSGRDQVLDLVALGEQEPVNGVLNPEGFLDPFADEVQHLTQAHQDADGTGDHHEQGEDLLLCGTADEAVNGVGAGIQGAFGQPDGWTRI